MKQENFHGFMEVAHERGPFDRRAILSEKQ